MLILFARLLAPPLPLSTPLSACPSLPQVAREGFVVFFSEVFDAMFRLCADSEANVQNAVQFLDNLVKVTQGSVGVCVLGGWADTWEKGVGGGHMTEWLSGVWRDLGSTRVCCTDE